MASIPGSVRVGGFIAPSDTTDTYATHDSLYGRGGLKEVSSTEERDAIPADRRREGMIVYVGGVVQANYQLIGGIDNANWAVLEAGGGGGVTDHGALTGLNDDDHTQYLNETRHDLLDHAGLTGIPSITGLLDETAHDLLDHTGLTGIPTQYTDEMAQDAIGTLISNGTQSGITVTYDDANAKLDFTVTASGAGDVTGPASSVDSNFALFNGTTGKVIKDGGVKASDFATASHNHTSVYEPANTNIQSHISSTSNQHPATSITNTPAGNISATTVQAAINELDTEKAAVTQLHDAVTVADSTSIDLTLTGQQISAAAIFGTTSGTVAEGNHNHSGIYQPADQQLTDFSGLSYSGNGGKVIAVTAGADGLELISVSTGTGMINPMTASGDIIYGGTSGTPTRLAKGTDGQVLTLTSGNPSWAAASGGDGPLVAERIITAEDGAQTRITFSDLDGNADGGYVLVYGAKNATASNSSIKITINNDYTANNYNWREIFKSSTGSGTASADGADNAISNASGGYLGANLDNAVVINIVPSIDSTTIFTTASYNNGAVDFITTKYKSSTNITRIDLTASVASSIAVGSTFRLYKRK